MRRDCPAPRLLRGTAALCILAGLWKLPAPLLRVGAVGLGTAVLLLTGLWKRSQERREAAFANRICETLDALAEGRSPEKVRLYADSQLSKVQGRLLQYHDRFQEERRRSEADRQELQELVSDISHQVKTPMSNIRMFADLLRRHNLPQERREEFLSTLSAQAEKLDFLMQALIKMSRLEAGTVALHLEDASLYDTIARAVGGVLAAAERKGILIDVDCGSGETVRHDPKWTAEALGNLLDNAVKYTPEGGRVRVRVRPWQFYTRVDVEDTGIGIPAEQQNDVFKRFYRAQPAASAEGVGLGLYLAREIITRQKGYLTLKSEAGKGSVFSVFLLR